MSVVGNLARSIPSALGNVFPSGRDPRYPTSSAYGRPVALVYGTRRISVNLVMAGWYMLNKVTGGGGYGTWSNGLVQMAICEGPISEVLAVWKGRTKNTPGALSLTVQTGAGITAWNSGTAYVAGDWVSSGGTNYVSILAGTNHVPPNATYWAARGAAATERAQSPWSHMTTNFPLFALGYGGTAICSASTVWSLLSDGQLESATVEVSGLLTTATGSAQSVSPARVIADLLTNGEYGLAWATSRLDGYSGGAAFTAGIDGTAETSYANLVSAGGMSIALALEEQRPAREIIEEIATATDSVCLWSEGKLKMRPLATWYGTSGVTYDGPSSVVPVYDLGASGPGADFLADEGEEPIQVEREALKDHFNTFPVEWTNRAPARVDTAGTTIAEPFNAYNPDLEEGTPDPGDVEIYGVKKAPKTALRCIVSQGHAAYISNALASRSILGRNVYRFRLGWKFALLECCDVVTLTDAELGISRKLVRIVEMEEGDDDAFDVVAEEIGTVGLAGLAPLTVAMVPTYVSGIDPNGPPYSSTTDVATAMAYGGSGSFTYAWTKTSGTTVTVDSPTSASTTFTSTASGNVTAVYRCTVTDTVTSATAYAEVSVELDGGV